MPTHSADTSPLASQTTLFSHDDYHVAVTYDGQTLTLYLNGVLDTQRASMSAMPASPGASFQIDPLSYVEEVRVWN